MKTSTLRLGGVPEHFNLPIHLAIEQGMFKNRRLDITWTDFYGGTGEMTKALRNGDIDVCILLTEGIITDIIQGNPSKIISEYVITPLTWGIHTGVHNTLSRYEDIFDKKYAISRWGSGSHLMAIVDANSKGKHLKKDQFQVIKNLKGALDSLEAQETDVFYWEKYTTKPYVDAGQLKRIGEYLTPWPCFVIAASNHILANQPEQIATMLRTIHDSCDNFMQDESNITLVGRRYEQAYEDAARWYHSTEWAVHGWVSDKMMKSVIYHLHSADIIDRQQEIPEIIWRRQSN